MPDDDQPIPTRIEFIQFHQPALKDGNYRVTVAEAIETTETTGTKKISPTTFSIRRKFVVSGERFSLDPQEMMAVFPPAGSLGDHFNVLPHIQLMRSTLPWERAVGASHAALPWLALLLFDEDEKPTPKIVTAAELKTRLTGAVKWPGIQLEAGQHDTDKVTTIDVKKRLLGKLMPTPEALAYLAHVRQGIDANGEKLGDETAFVIGNRLPSMGAISTVHLVSLEGRFGAGGFNYQGARDDDSIRLVSLRNWSFACLDEKQSFLGLLLGLDRSPSTLRYPASADAEAEAYLAAGKVPLPHSLRGGGKTFSWYHGPLAPGAITDRLEKPVRAADELLRYSPATGLFDASYAAAWELGRLLTLRSKQVSVALFNWKRAHKQHLGCARQQLEHLHLPPHGQLAEVPELPVTVTNWFSELGQLKGVPFNYLVPDEALLPRESIRFFQMDDYWVDCLLDGAFSIGRVIPGDHQADCEHEAGVATNPHPQVSGFLLRSDVVSGWPGLEVDGYAELISGASFVPAQETLEMVRMERLSSNVLICIFRGLVQTVDIHQKPETLHFGVDAPSTKPKDFRKRLRSAVGSLGTEMVDPIPYLVEETRIVNIADLGSEIKRKTRDTTFTSAQFAFQMIEGVAKARFSKKPELPV